MDPFEDSLGDWHGEGCCAIDDDAVSSRELFNSAVLLKRAVDDGDIAWCGECSVESCGAKIDCDGDVGVTFTEDGQEGPFVNVSLSHHTTPSEQRYKRL